MTTLNRAAAEALSTLPPHVVHACTDVTGFGLAGHASEIARASGCIVEIEAARVPVLPGALDLLEGNTPGGARTNEEYVRGYFEADPAADGRHVQLLFDPQTSGGLLVAIAASALDAALDAFASTRCAGLDHRPRRGAARCPRVFEPNSRRREPREPENLENRER